MRGKQLSTTSEAKADILGDLWVGYRDKETFTDFIEYSDLALPLAYCISNKIVDATPKAQMFIDESWSLLLEALGVEDEGFDTFEDLLIASGQDEI